MKAESDLSPAVKPRKTCVYFKECFCPSVLQKCEFWCTAVNREDLWPEGVSSSWAFMLLLYSTSQT